jgi:hypothetical protein
MLSKANELHFQVIRESYKDAILFYEQDGMFFIQGQDAQVVCDTFRLQARGAWLGFDGSEAHLYMQELAKLGYRIVHGWDGHAELVTLKESQPLDLARQRVNSTLIAIEPSVLIDKADLDPYKNETWVRRYRYEALLEQFMTWLKGGDWRSLRGYGQIYIYQVAEWYELDRELTTMAPDHVRVLLTASLIAGRKFPCRLVRPKGRRQLRPIRQGRKPDQEQTQTRFGQLRLAL